MSIFCKYFTDSRQPEIGADGPQATADEAAFQSIVTCVTQLPGKSVGPDFQNQVISGLIRPTAVEDPNPARSSAA